MILKEIELKNFRNYPEIKLSFSPEINILIGQNAQGKTNLIESIFLLSLASSHRTSDIKELISFEQENSVVKALIEKEVGNTLLEIDISKKGKLAKVNNLSSKTLSEFIGNLNVVLFAPEDLNLVKGTPSDRRKFINAELGQISNKYLFDIGKFNSILKQRNALLKAENIDPEFLDILDEQLTEYAAKVIVQRREFIKKLSILSNRIHFEIASTEELEISYKTANEITEIDNQKEIQEKLLKQLEKNRKRDVILKTTSVGPHHDDLEFKINQKKVSSFASQGQQRTVALSIRLAEIELIKETVGEYPVLLLDDVFSELDSERQTSLIKFIENKVQTFITTPSLNDVKKQIINKPKIFTVKDGEIENDWRK